MTDPRDTKPEQASDSQREDEPDGFPQVIQDLDTPEDDADEIRAGACPKSRPV